MSQDHAAERIGGSVDSESALSGRAPTAIGGVVPALPVIGIDIGGTNTEGVLLSPIGDVIAQLSIPTGKGPTGVVESAKTVISKLAAHGGIAPSQLAKAIAGIGIGIPGVVDVATGVVNYAVNLGISATPLPLAAKLQSEFQVPVFIDNDLNVGALGAGELIPDDNGKPVDIAYLSLGTGVAAGYVLEGKLRQGDGIVGEVGHIPINPAGPQCKCGQRGCLELYSSGSALASKWPAQGDIPGPQALLQAAQAGDRKAIDILSEFYFAVAIAVRNLILGIGPRKVIIGGGVTRLGQPLLDGVRAALDSLAQDSPFLQSLNMADRVTLIAPGAPVAAIGAAVLAKNQN